MNQIIAAIILVCTVGTALAFDPLAVGPDDWPETDDETLVSTILYCDGWPWKRGLDTLAKKQGGEKVAERLVEFMVPVFDTACVSAYNDRAYRLCRYGIPALAYLKATNSLPFLERAVLHGRKDLCDTALKAYQKIMGYGDAYLDLLDKALVADVITGENYATELTCFRNSMDAGRTPSTPKNKLAVAIRLVNNPYGYYPGGSENDNFLLTNFPSYSNSVERFKALTAMLENQLTPPEGHAKYGPERDRLKVLPPESLVRVTDQLEAQLDALLKAAERKRKIEQVKKYAVPAGAAVLALGVIAILFRRRGKKQ